MTAHTEALRKCVEVLKQVDFKDCAESEALWHQHGLALAEAERVLRDGERQEPATNASIIARFWSAVEGRHPVAIQPSVVAASDWKALLYAALDVEFELHNSHKRDADGQRMGLRDDDTQIGAEFAMAWFERAILAAPQPAAAPSGDVVEALHELALLMSDTIRGEYEPDSFTLQPAVHALASVGILFPDDDYLLTERELCAVVPVKPSAEMLKAMAESRAVDDEGEFPAMLDLLDFSGENKTRTVLEAAYVAAITATKE